MGFELAEAFDWDLPEVIVYPAGRGHRPGRPGQGL